MKCSECGHENRDAVKFCEECAAQLGRKCAGCGAELRAEHDMVVVCTVATRITVMHQSKLLAEGAPAEEVGARPELQRVSLGEPAT
jgi:ABC-type uncharacterized transport system ATPase subunit